MQVADTALPEVKLLLPRRHGDGRGWFVEVWNRRDLAAAGIVADFVQDNVAYSAARGTLRGLHFQRPPVAQGKLVRVQRGRIFDVAVDIRPDAATFGRFAAAVLSADGGEQMWIPPGFAHGYCTLEADCEVAYKVTAHYAPAAEGGVRFDDPALAIPWPLPPGDILANARDRALPRLADLIPAAARARQPAGEAVP